MKTYYLTAEPYEGRILVRVTDNPNDKQILMEVQDNSFADASKRFVFQASYMGKTGSLSIGPSEIHADVFD